VSRIIREVLFEERGRRSHGYIAAHDGAVITTVLSYGKDDGRILTELHKRPNGPEIVETLLAICSNSNLQRLLEVIRGWAERDNARRRFLDVVDKWTRRLQT